MARSNSSPWKSTTLNAIREEVRSWLQVQLRSPEPQLRADALTMFNWLELIEDPRSLLGFLEDQSLEVRRAAARALAYVDAPEVRSALLHAFARLSFPPDDIVESIGYISEDREFVPVLISVIERDQDEWTLKRAVSALGRIGDRRAFAPVAELYERSRTIPSWRSMRASALGALRSLDLESAGPIARRSLEVDTVPCVRKEAAEILGALGDLSSVPLVAEAVYSEDEELSLSALERSTAVTGGPLVPAATKAHCHGQQDPAIMKERFICATAYAYLAHRIAGVGEDHGVDDGLGRSAAVLLDPGDHPSALGVSPGSA